MFQHYLKIILRSFARNKVTSFINIVGLSVGITACLLIFLFVQNELGYDRHNPKADRLYRVNSEMTLSGNAEKLARSSFMVASTLKAEYPEVEEAVRIMHANKQTLWYDNQTGDAQVFQIEDTYFADPAFFQLFNYDFLEGNPATALKAPGSLVLSDETARLVFGTDRGVLGKTLRFTQNSYRVTGVFKARKTQSHLRLNAMCSLNSLPKSFTDQLSSDWFYMAMSSYVLFRDARSAKGFDAKLGRLVDQHVKPWLQTEKVEGSLKFILQPLTAIHLSTEFGFDTAERGNASYLYIFSVVAVFVLLIVCINYVNLATAQATRRAKEVGIRKAVGVSRLQLIRQFMGESFVTCLLAVLLAILLTSLLLKPFNELTGKSFGMDFTRDAAFFGFLLVVIVLVGFLAGSYPALVVSRFNPVLVLKGNKLPRSSGVWLRKGLVVAQFSISIILIVGTVLVFRQMDYMKNKSVGFDREQILVLKVPVADSSFVGHWREIKEELLQNPSVVEVAGTNNLPGSNAIGSLLFYLTQNAKTVQLAKNFMLVDHDFLKMLKIPVLKGRNFSRDFHTDDKEAFILNEAAAKAFGWKEPLGEKLMNGLGYDGKVIGVVKDFNYQSLHNPIEPLVLMLAPDIPSNLLIKIRPENMRPTITFVEATWKRFSTRYPTEYFFLDDSFNKSYLAEEKMLTVFTYFSVLTILIACLGLFGLVTFTAEQRTKEIGIRKVLGASVSNIVTLLSAEFMKLVLLANILAWPLAYYAMNHWLQDFAYRISIPWWIFVLAAALALVIALLTVSFQAIRAATANPVKSLRTE